MLRTVPPAAAAAAQRLAALLRSAGAGDPVRFW